MSSTWVLGSNFRTRGFKRATEKSVAQDKTGKERLGKMLED